MSYTENITRVLSSASPAQILSGAQWYTEAHNLALEISPDDIRIGAGIIAAYSIQAPWNRTVINARQTMATRIPAPHTGMVKGKASRILAGENPISVLGPKTSAFYSTIVDDNTDMVTIDRHARDIAFGYSVFKNPSIGVKLYRELSQAYRDVAADNSIKVSECQAITWVVWRDSKNITWAG